MSDRTTDERAGDGWVSDNALRVMLADGSGYGGLVRIVVRELLALRAAHGPGRCEPVTRHAFAINCCSRGIENIVHLPSPAVEGAAERPHTDQCLAFGAHGRNDPDRYVVCICACHRDSDSADISVLEIPCCPSFGEHGYHVPGCGRVSLPAAVTPGAHAFVGCWCGGDECRVYSCGQVESAAVHS